MSDEEQGRVISLADRRAAADARAAELARAQARQQARRPDGQAPAKPWLTYTLIGLNAAVWIVMVGAGVDFYEPTGAALLDWGGNLGILTSGGQWWRLLTAMFLHAGIIHLAFNLYFLWVVGRVTEQIFGPVAYALVYFGSGLLASLTSVLWQPGIVSVGASGALFGVFGAFLGFTIRRRDVLPPQFVSSVRRNALILLGINLAISFAVPSIDIAAHIGGLVAGLAIGYAIAWLAEKPVRTPQEAARLKLRAIGLSAAVTVLALVGGALAAPRWDNPLPVLDEAVDRDVEIVAAWNAAQTKDARVQALEQEIIPKNREMLAKLTALERLPKPWRGIVDAQARYFELRTAAFERELDGLRNDDPAAIAESDRLLEQAEAALAEADPAD